MSNLMHLLQGLSVCLQPMNLLYALAGGVLGVIVGALPGLGSVAGTALLLPLTYTMNPTAAIIMLAAIYYGNMFGGAISAILINIPGDAPAVMTALDGYAMTRQGRAGQALFTAFLSSFIGGLIGAILLTLMGSFMASIGLKFGPGETTMLILVAMTSIGWILGDNPAKGLVATGFGLILACVGLDAQVGGSRLTFGIFHLLAGIPFIPTIIGFFGFSQVIRTMVDGIEKQPEIKLDKITYKNSFPSRENIKRCLPVVARGSLLGFVVGMLPGSGATTAAFLSYITEKRINRRKGLMGTGIPEGVAISESSNNAASIGAFGPLLSLGIPGSGTAAVLMGGLIMWGLQPGPLFMSQNQAFSWSLIASMFTGDILIAIVCIATIPVLVNLLKVPNKILVPIILCISMMGAFCVNNSVEDIYIMLIFGFVGYLFLRFNIPMAPIALAMCLCNMLETAIRQGFIISKGSLSIFFKSGLSKGLFAFGVLFIILPIIIKLITSLREKKQAKD